MNKVQEALKSALFTIRCYRTEITLDKKLIRAYKTRLKYYGVDNG
jgi:hypothetical protein